MSNQKQQMERVTKPMEFISNVCLGKTSWSLVEQTFRVVKYSQSGAFIGIGNSRKQHQCSAP